ncbi:MAG: DUF488 domain-containing protein [Candidatus Acidiferrum sp.]|jgi:uncharacterized protein (DUF488 family)
MTAPAAKQPKLFTLGHSNLGMSDLLGMLVRHEIKVLCDVRSRPGSFRYPQFNRQPLEARLTAAKIRYEFFGEQLGGRPLDPRFYLPNGMVDYAGRRKAPDFLEAVDRTIARAREAPTAILCAEEDPLHCHRFLLICPALVQKGAVPLHLRRGGVIEPHRDGEDRLLQLHGFADVTSDSLFVHGREAALEDALRLQAEQYAFRTSPEAIEYF